MTERDDIALLREFVATESESAFAALVERHVNLVYSTALRSVGGAHAAQEITQAVFILLARKAKSLSAKTILAGWLHQATRLTAANFLRGEIRRQQREQEAYMQSTLNEPDASVWPQIAPLLDDALDRLGERDRHAIVLRFFENKNLREVGTALGASEDAAKMRVNRALEKLRKMFAKRGVTLTAAAIAGAVSANSVHAAPAGLAVTISATAVKSSAVAASTLTLVKGALKIMAWTKMKTGVVAGAAILLATGTTTLIVSSVQASRRASPPDIQGAWEGVEEIRSATGVQQGELAKSRIVFNFFRTNGAYRANGEFIDTAPEPFQVTSFTYDYPAVSLDAGQNVSYKGKLKAHATEISGTFQTRGFSVPMLLKRTAAPPAAPVPLAKNDYAPRAGSDLQGTWKAVLGSVSVTIKIAEPSAGIFRAELDNLTTSWLGQPLVVTYNPPGVELRVASGAGMFQGEVRNGNSELAGNWVQGGRQTPVIFQRADR